MDEQELEQKLRAVQQTWRVAGEPPLDEMWQVIEARSFSSIRAVRPWYSARTLLPLAAVLLLGFGLGQLTPLVSRPSTVASEMAKRVSPNPQETPVALTAAPDAPFVGIATDYLERVTALLVTLTDATRRGQPLGPSANSARDLLATTRLLIDSPQAGDPHLQALLGDLELVLAQIVRLPGGTKQPDVSFIDQTLDEREVLPRLRVLLAENTSSQP